jgi:hypothetical protein
MTFDEYLTEYYGFDTTDRKWRGMGISGKTLLKDSYKMDMAKLEKGPKLSPQVATSETEKGQDIATLYQTNKQ